MSFEINTQSPNKEAVHVPIDSENEQKISELPQFSLSIRLRKGNDIRETNHSVMAEQELFMHAATSLRCMVTSPSAPLTSGG